MNVFQTNKTSRSFELNVSNFNADNKVEIATTGTTEGNEKFDITPTRLHPFTSGLYVTLKDIGTCIDLTRFRSICYCL